MKHPPPPLTAQQSSKVTVKATAANLVIFSGNSSKIIPLPQHNVAQHQQDVVAAAPHHQTEVGGSEVTPPTSSVSQQPAEQRCTSYSGSSAGGNASRKADGSSEEGPAARDCRSWNIVPQPNYMLPVLAATSTVMSQSPFVPSAVKKLYAKLRRQKLYALLKLIIIIVFPIGIIAIGISTEPYFIAAVPVQERIPLAIFSSIPSLLALLTFLPDMQWELNLIVHISGSCRDGDFALAVTSNTAGLKRVREGGRKRRLLTVSVFSVVIQRNVAQELRAKRTAAGVAATIE